MFLQQNDPIIEIDDNQRRYGNRAFFIKHRHCLQQKGDIPFRV